MDDYEDKDIEVVDAETFDQVMELTRECARALTMDEAWAASEKCYAWLRAHAQTAKVQEEK